MKQNSGFYTLCAGAIKKALRPRLSAGELPNCMANIKVEHDISVKTFDAICQHAKRTRGEGFGVNLCNAPQIMKIRL